jgi:hypothetical protein
MTTKVTVDAHAGWPVRVEAVDTILGQSSIVELAVVLPNTSQDFYCFETRQLIISELRRSE